MRLDAAACRTGRPRSPAEHACTHVPPGEAGQITPNPSVHGGLVPQGPLGDTNPTHPSNSTGVS